MSNLTLKIIGAALVSLSIPLAVLLSTPVLLNRLGLEAVAQYNLIFLVLNVMMIPCQGLFTVSVKEMSAEAAGRIKRMRLVEKGLLVLVIALAAPSYVLGWPVVVVAMMLLMLNYYCAVLVGMGQQFLQGILFFATHMAAVCALYVMSGQMQGMSGFLLVYAAVALAGVVLLRVAIGRLTAGLDSDSQHNLSWREMREVTVSEGFGIFTSLADRAAIYLFMPAATFGAYSIATTIGKAPSLIRAPMLRIIMPYLFNRSGEVWSKTTKSALILCFAIMPGLAILSFYCAEILQLWVGPQPDLIVDTTRLVLVGAGFHTLAVPYYYSLIHMEQSRIVARFSIALSIVSFAGVVACANLLDMQAVAAVWVVSNMVIFGFCYGTLSRHLRIGRAGHRAMPILLVFLALPIILHTLSLFDQL